jgi:hypothetical protein
LYSRFFPSGAKTARMNELQAEIRKALDASAQSKP